MKRISLLLSLVLITIQTTAQWTSVPSGTSIGLSDIYFPNDSVGYIIGDYGIVLKSTTLVIHGKPFTKTRPTHLTRYFSLLATRDMQQEAACIKRLTVEAIGPRYLPTHSIPSTKSTLLMIRSVLLEQVIAFTKQPTLETHGLL